MSNAEEFEKLVAVALHTIHEDPGSLDQSFFYWCANNRDLITRALKTQAAFDRSEYEPERARRYNDGFFAAEETYATDRLLHLCKNKNDTFRRGFQEGWRALRQFIIQNPAT